MLDSMGMIGLLHCTSKSGHFISLLKGAQTSGEKGRSSSFCAVEGNAPLHLSTHSNVNTCCRVRKNTAVCDYNLAGCFSKLQFDL